RHLFSASMEPQPVHTTGWLPASAAPLSVTTVPVLKLAEQVEPQSMPAGELVTLPPPVPAFLTLSRCSDDSSVTVTVLAALIVTRHLFSASTLSQPVQEGFSVFGPGAAVRETAVPIVKLAKQVAPQLIPAGELVTVPVPAPFFSTVSLRLTSSKVAVTVFAVDIVTLHFSSRLTSSQPDHWTAVLLGPETAERTTFVPSAKGAA